MSWLSDVTGINVDIAKPVQNALNPVNLFAEGSEARRFVQGVQQIGQNAADFVWKIPEAGFNAVTGKWDDAGKSLKQFGGAALGVNATIANPVLYAGYETNAGKELLKNPTLSKLTLGLSEDYAGLSSGSRSLRSTGDLSNADRDSIGRYFSKVGVVIGASSVLSGVSAADQGAKAGQLYAASQAAARGDLAGVVTGVSGLVPGLPDILPKRPDWLPSIDLTPALTQPAPQAPRITETNPWTWGGIAESGMSPLSSSSNGIAIAAVVVLGVYLLRKRGVI